MSKHLRLRTKSISNIRGRRVGRTCLALLEKTLLVDDVAIESAICSLEAYIVDPGVDLDDLIVELESVPHLLEYVLSGLNDYPFRVIHDAILQSFPNTPDAFASSLASRLLNRFSVSLLFLPSSAATDAFELLNQYRRAVELAPPVLRTLACTSFAEDVIEDDDGASPTSPTSPTKRRSQQKRKQAAKASRAPAIDGRPFENYGVSVPATKSAAADLGATVLEEQMTILKYYLDICRNTALAPVFKNAYLPPSSPETYDTPAERSVQASQDDEITYATDLGAYPLVQPMKAALYFDSAKGFGQWRILISNGASQYLRQARKKDPSTFKIIINKIKALSNGHFSDDNQKKLTGSEVQVPIFEAKMTRDTRLVYQIDCVPEYQSNVERQVIRIFGIYTHSQIGRCVWQGMGWQVARKGADYVDRCNYRKSVNASRGDVFLPGSWPPLEADATVAELPMPSFVKDDLDEMHSLLVLEKFVTFSQALLNGIMTDQNITHVFDVSPNEKRIIEHPSSCYVLGRSGTGKTTTMLFKMLGIERSWEDFRETLPKPRQMFVTQSRVLAEKVEEYFADLFRSLLAGKQTRGEVMHRSAQHAVLVDKDEEVWHRGDLPERFGSLSDEHFPMFLTFDQICRLLENEYLYELEERQKHDAISQAIQDVMEFRHSTVQSRGWSSDHIRKRQNAFVSEAKFIAEYWPHVRQGLPKGLDPTFVFAEFIGIIKGSEQALEQPDGYLDQETYCASRRSQAVNSNQREHIYQSFQAYVKRKAERGDWDVADRSHALIRSLRGGIPGQPIDFMYVDEAQDNLLIDAFILRNLCRNPHGMFWAGDTAQTISAGSAFRFNDLKAFMYRLEENMAAVTGIKQVQPESFQLAVNYRSHAGIVNCAHTVVQLITSFWPYAIDNLAQEKGIVDGLKPVFFSGWDQDTARYEQFLFGESGSHIEFGAQQCILVRNEGAREKLRNQVGEIGLILTLYEAKGLEFNDVLLYNFFEDSTADASQWRVVLNALPADEHVSAPRFDEIRHNSICRELKFLYVAITRARKNLWIADSSVKGEPIRTLWDCKGQVETCTPGSDVPQLAMSSSPEEWAATALSLFNNKRYAQAMHCYERAGLPREKAVAHAYTLRDEARAAPVNSHGGTLSQADAYALAAEAFLASAHDAVAEKLVYFRIAAECFVSNGDYARAADAYQAASEYDLAAKHYRQAGRFDSAVEIIKSHSVEMEDDVVQTITEVSKLYYLREHEVKKARDLFESDDEALEYMEDFGLDVARATMLEELGKYAEAAELLVEEGNPLEALRLLTLAHGDSRSTKRAAEVILACLWSVLPLGVDVTEKLVESHPTLRLLLAHAERLLSDDLVRKQLDDSILDEIAMFLAIASKDYARLVRLSGRFSSRENFASSLLCLDYVFSGPLNLSSLSLTGLATTLRTFLVYARLLHQFAFRLRPSYDATICTLFRLRFWTEDLVFVPTDAFVLTHATGKNYPLEQSPTGQGYLVSRWEVDSLVNRVLQQRLLTKVIDENSTCWRLKSLRPCLTFAVSLKCTREGCRQYHGDTQYYSTASYNIRVRVHLLQMLICRTVNALELFPQQIARKRLWLYQLYSTLLPAHPNLGALHALSVEHVPELVECLRLVRLWTEDVLFKLESKRTEEQYLTQLVQAVLLGLTFDRTAALQYLRRVRCTTVDRPPELLRKIGDDRSCYVVHDLMRFLENDVPTSLNSGFLFVNHIIDKEIPIDVTTFCDLMDHLCSCLILATWGRSTERVRLHNVILPKSWILRVMPYIHRLPSMDIGLSFLYRRNLANMLHRVEKAANDSGHLLFEASSLNKVSVRIRNVFLLRILRTLAFWGYNVNVPSLRNEILGIITSLRSGAGTDKMFPPSIEQYVAARHWDDLGRIVRTTTFGASSAEELIQLHHGTTAHTASSRYIRHVTYTHAEDISRLLNSESLGILNAAVEPSSPPTSVPSLATVAPEQLSNGRVDSAGISSVIPAPEEEPKHDVTVVEPQPGDVEEVALSIDADQVNVEAEAPSAEKLEAAMVLLTFYRHRAARKSALKKKTSEEAKLRIYTAFLEESKKLQFPHRYYRLLFLGPLPHLFAVVEAMKNHLYEAKNHAKKRLNIVQHLELENMGSSLTEITRRHKNANNLHQALGPASLLHHERNSEKLRTYALEAYELMKTFPAAVSSKWNADMDIAMRGIVEVKKVAKPKKPEVNIEEEDHGLLLV